MKKMKAVSTGLTHRIGHCSVKFDLQKQTSMNKQNLLRLSSMKRNASEKNTSTDNSNRPKLPFLKNLPAYQTSEERKTTRLRKIHEQKTYEVDTASRMREKVFSYKQINSKKNVIADIEATLKDTERMRNQVFDSITKEPAHSFKVVSRYRSYEKIWGTYEGFYNRNLKKKKH